jgi:hypothetical protein
VADAFVLTFASDAATVIHGSAWGAGSWNKPITRTIHRIA